MLELVFPINFRKFYFKTDRMDYKELCFKVQEIANQAGNFIREERKKITTADVELKSAASLVTYVDKNAEKKIVSN